MENHLYTINDIHLQIAHTIARKLNEKQQQIEPEKKGIITELGKLISYLDSKIKQNINLPQAETKPARFFTYLELLAEHSDTLGHSNKTIEYYQAIDEVCKIHIKDYKNKPFRIMQILGWTQRLMHYYKTLDSDEINQLQAKFNAAKLNNQNISKPIPQKSQTPKSPQKPQLHKPIPKTQKSQPINKPKAQKPVQKSAASPKLKKPNTLQPPKPWERPPKPPK